MNLPTEEEVAAIVAAVDAAWPRPPAPAPPPADAPVWRFSGRWWTRPATVRRECPWLLGAQ